MAEPLEAITKPKDRKSGAQHLRLLLLLMLFQPVTNAYGQNTLIKGGINLASLAGIPEQGSLVGYHIGIGGMKELSGHLALKSELIFSQQGTKLSDDDRLAIAYLNMPVLLNMRLGENFSFDAGPQIGLALDAWERGEIDRNITPNLKTFDISICIGANYFISKHLFAEGRFNLGLTNLRRLSETDSFRNAVFQGSVGYYFNRKNEEAE
jgi:hypothetical protein